MIRGLEQASAELLSRERIPPNPDQRPGRVGALRWYSLDSEAAYRKRPHPTIGPDPALYQINSDGYRCPELAGVDWQADETVRVVGIGSSGLFGTGLPESDTLLAQFARLLEAELGRPVTHWNLGVGGTSADYVSRMLFSVLPVMRPDVVLLTAFPINRRELFGESGRPLAVDARPHWQHRLLDPERFALHRACQNICNPHSDLINFVLNMKTWESLCDDAGVPWLFMSESYARHLKPLEGHLRDARKLVGPGMFELTEQLSNEPATGLARDFLHPGQLPNRLFAENMFERLLALYPGRLAQLRQPAPVVGRVGA